MKVKIYVVTHKVFLAPDERIYVPIIAGSFEYGKKLFPDDYLRDDTKENISIKHDMYSEFTVDYWVWKNSKYDIVGINHYRRFFILGGWISYLRCIYNPTQMINKFILDKKTIIKDFAQGYNCILPKKQYRVKRTLMEEYYDCHTPELLDCACQIIKRDYPQYKDTMVRVLNSKDNYQKCICIMRKDLFDRYCKWIFDILEKLEKTECKKMEREYAYLSERLFNVWIEKNRDDNLLRIKERFFVNTDYTFKNISNNPTEFIIPKNIRGIVSCLNVIRRKKGGKKK